MEPHALDRTRCAVCGTPHKDPAFAATYVTLVCRECESRSVNSDGDTPFIPQPELVKKDGERVMMMPGDWGDNPLFIDGHKCWRRYKFGGWVTMRDYWDSPEIGDFYEHIFRHKGL